MSNLPPLDPESRLLIGGELRGASNGATFENIDPATEEVLGECADGTKEDMDAAVAAARRAFDETSWSEDHAFRKKCLMQLHDALQEAKESLRAPRLWPQQIFGISRNLPIARESEHWRAPA